MAQKCEPTPIFFDSPDAFYAWLEANHDKETEVWVGYWKTHTGEVLPERMEFSIRRRYEPALSIRPDARFTDDWRIKAWP